MRIHVRLAPTLLKIVFGLILSSLVACGGGQVQKEEAPQPPLSKKYQRIVLMDYQGTPEVVKDYFKSLEKCRTSTINALQAAGSFKRVGRFYATTDYDENDLLVKATVTQMRIVGVAARVWGGAFAGRSYMNLDVRLIDGATREEIRSKLFYSSNNPFAASWVGGISDRSLPADMGKMMAAYLVSVTPKP